MRMSSKEWRTSAVLRRLEHAPQQFEFFQAIRLLEAKYSRDLNYLLNKVLRFYVKTSLAFPQASLEKIDFQEKITVFTQLYGLNTTNGPMAIHYLETLMMNESLKETALLDFINMFNHRILALFYQCWKKYRIYLDIQHQKILAAFTHRDSDAYLHYAGVWAQHTQSAEGLAVIIGDFFRLPVEVIQHVGRWLSIPKQERSCLGAVKGQYHALGQTTLLGQAVWDVLSQVKLILNIDEYSYFRDFLPRQRLFKVLCQRVRDYMQMQYCFEIELHLVPNEVPVCQLRREDQYRLGWDSWLASAGTRTLSGCVRLQDL